MATVFPAAGGVFRRLARLFCVLIAAALTGCANLYLDASTQDVAAAEFKRPARPRPVQVLFEFQTSGALNARATEQLKVQVLEEIRRTALFAQVDERPVNGGAILGVTLNNVPLSDDAAQQGFATGLTFGLVGSQVTDGYICTVRYRAEGDRAPVVKVARHAIHTTLGTGSPPPGAIRMNGFDDAVRAMTRQVIHNALRDLSRDPSFH